MKTRPLIIIGIVIIGFVNIAFADTPIPEPEQDIPVYENCGPRTILQDGICVVDEIENSTKSSSGKWGGYPYSEFTDEQICGVGYVLVDGICEVIITESREHWPVSSFTDGLFFIIVILPFFIPGALIFIVVSKTPRFSKSVILSVSIPAIIAILYFLSGLFLGWYPPGYA